MIIEKVFNQGFVERVKFFERVFVKLIH